MIDEIYNNTLRFASCRGPQVSNISRSVPLHTIREMVFLVEIMTGRRELRDYINESLAYTKHIDLINPEDYRYKDLQKVIDNCDAVFIELSTLSYSVDANGNIGQTNRIRDLVKDGTIDRDVFTCHKLTYEEIVDDLEKLKTYLPGRSFYCQSHITFDTTNEEMMKWYVNNLYNERIPGSEVHTNYFKHHGIDLKECTDPNTGELLPDTVGYSKIYELCCYVNESRVRIEKIIKDTSWFWSGTILSSELLEKYGVECLDDYNHFSKLGHKVINDLYRELLHAQL